MDRQLEGEKKRRLDINPAIDSAMNPVVRVRKLDRKFIEARLDKNFRKDATKIFKAIDKNQISSLIRLQVPEINDDFPNELPKELMFKFKEKTKKAGRTKETKKQPPKKRRAGGSSSCKVDQPGISSKKRSNKRQRLICSSTNATRGKPDMKFIADISKSTNEQESSSSSSASDSSGDSDALEHQPADHPTNPSAASQQTTHSRKKEENIGVAAQVPSSSDVLQEKSAIAIALAEVRHPFFVLFSLSKIPFFFCRSRSKVDTKSWTFSLPNRRHPSNQKKYSRKQHQKLNMRWIKKSARPMNGAPKDTSRHQLT